MAEWNNGAVRADRAARGEAIDAGLRSYMLRVFNLMALGVAFTAIVTLFISSNPALMQVIAVGPFKWVLFAAVLGLGFFAPRIIMGGNTAMAHLCYWGYAALWGALIAPMIFLFMQSAAGQMDIVRALLITSVMFGLTSFYGYVTKRDLSGLGTFFLMASIGLLVAMLINVFFVESTLFSFITSALVVLLFAGVTAYETQMIKELYYEGDSREVATGKAIFGAFALYGSFITIFIHVLNMLGIARSE